MENDLRIGYDARYVRDSYGGIARFAFELLWALARLDNGIAYVVYHDPSQQASRFDLDGLFRGVAATPRPTTLPLHSLREQIAWPRLLRGDRVDLFYSPYFALPLLANVPTVSTVHDLIFEHDPMYRRRPWIRLYYRPMMRLGLRRAAAVATVSLATKRALVAFYGCDQRRIAIVPEAADTFRPQTDESALSEVRRRLNLPERYVLALGARRPHKNLGAAVRALAAIRARVPHHLVLVGGTEPSYPDDVAIALAATGMRDRVHELASVREQDLSAVYSLAAATIVPSLAEGFGLPALESMACGTPVVAADRSSLPEVVGDAGLLVDPTDDAALASALLRVLRDAGLRDGLRRRGLRRASEFTWRRSAEQMAALFRGVTANRRRPGGPGDL